jgi:hypothetical protein
MSDGLLFETSPLEGGDQVRKKGGRKQQPQEPVYQAPPPEPVEAPVGFLLSIDDVCCPQCGAPADLVEVLLVDGRKKWRVMCGWWCMIRWTIDPIPGLLAERGPKPFVIREGRFAGKTFDEVSAMGEEWYINDLVSLAKNEKVKAAARDWLAQKTA